MTLNSSDACEFIRMNANRSTDVPGSTVDFVDKELSYTIVGAFFEVYNKLGYGFLESIYSRALEVALRRRNVLVEREVPMVVYFDGVEVGHHRADMLIERRVIIELKATDRLPWITQRQVRNYLAALNLRLGLILHFGPSAHIYRVLRPRSSNDHGAIR